MARQTMLGLRQHRDETHEADDEERSVARCRPGIDAMRGKHQPRLADHRLDEEQDADSNLVSAAL